MLANLDGSRRNDLIADDLHPAAVGITAQVWIDVSDESDENVRLSQADVSDPLSHEAGAT
jgi:hypothetical protein